MEKIKLKIKKGDSVQVITGADKGTKGKVLGVFPKLNKVLVEGVREVKKRRGARKSNEKGQTLTVATPIHISNVKKI